MRNISFKHLQTPEEISQVKSLRETIPIASRLRDDLAFQELEIRRDQQSIVGAFIEGSKIIGTVRIIPFSSGLTHFENVLKNHPPLPSELLFESCEIGRLVLDPNERQGMRLLTLCFARMGEFLFDQSQFLNGFALCNQSLARLYQYYGWNKVIENASQSDDGIYSLIHANRETSKNSEFRKHKR